MKSFIVTSFAMSMFTFMGTAEAGIIPEGQKGLPNTYKHQLCAKASGCAGASNYQTCFESSTAESPMMDLCETLKTVEAEHSDNENEWREHIFAAQAAYHKAIGGKPGGTEAYGSEIIPVSTNAADSNYEDKGGDHKGFLNSEQQ